MQHRYSTDHDDTTPPLIELSAPGAGLSPRLLSSPGGFLWWYLDLIDDEKNGLVVIWSFGLPFLPGYTHAARVGRPQRPRQRPSLNVSVVRDGTLDFYLLQEFHPREVHWDPTPRGDRWKFGRSRIESFVAAGRRRVTADLHLDVPRCDDVAHVELEASGPGCVDDTGCHDPTRRRCRPIPQHDWTPLLAACRGRAQAMTGDAEITLRGRVYHDRNGGSAPLHRLGIDDWVWGRIAVGERELIYYDLNAKSGASQTLLLSIDAHGEIRHLEDCEFRRRRSRTNLAGLTWWPAMSVRRNGSAWLNIEAGDVVDSGPFYLRTLLEATDRKGRNFRGIGEVCDPDRVDLPHHRPLVKMRVHRRSGDNSMWLPLFSGPRSGRITRLIRSMLPITRSSR